MLGKSEEATHKKTEKLGEHKLLKKRHSHYRSKDEKHAFEATLEPVTG